MSRSSVSICNMALANIASQEILVSLTDEGRAAALCNLFYPEMRDELLEEYPWSFATTTAALALSSETVPGYAYAYAWPIDCLRPMRVCGDQSGYQDGPTLGQGARIAFETRATEAGRVIASDEASAQLVYVKRVEDATLYTGLFSDALAWKLSARLALALLRDERVAQSAADQFRLALMAAQEADASMNHIMVQEGASWHAL